METNPTKKLNENKLASLRSERLERAAERKKRLEPHYQTRSIDYKKLVSVRVDSKTTLLVKPGTNIEVLRKKYLKKINDWKVVAQPAYIKVKKLKPL